MKSIKTVLLILGGLVLLTTNCRKDKLPDEVEDMRQMAVPATFNFEATSTLDLVVKLPATVDYSERLKRVEVYDNDPNLTGELINAGGADNQGVYRTSIQIANDVDTLYIHSFAGWLKLGLTSGTKGMTDEYEANYGNDYAFEPPDSTPDGVPGNGDGIQWKPNLKSGGNFISNGEFSTNDFGKIAHWNSVFINDNRWHLSNGLRTQAAQFQDGDNFVLRTTGTNSTIYGGVAQFIDAEEGEEITFSADIRRLAGTANVWIYLIPYNSRSQPIRYFSILYSNPRSSWTSKTVTATMPAQTEYCEVLFWSHNYRSSIIDYDNAVVNIKGRVTDTDGDGVEDDEDAYPNDANKAFNNYYPSEAGFGTLAFEDMWPSEGDYDFNDLVVGYRFNHIKNAENQITNLSILYKLRAIGASIQNGFGFQLDVGPGKISTVNSSYSFEADNLTIAGNGTEANQTKATFIVFADAFNVLSHDGGGLGINTDPARDYVEPVDITYNIEFSEGLSMEDIGNAPNNPFLFRTKTRGWEIHLPGYLPTDLADESKFGTGHDATNPDNEYYYKTARGLPWGMNLPVEFVYPIEKAPIITGHLKFQQWAVSGGYSYMDWYGNIEGYRNNSNLFIR